MRRSRIGVLVVAALLLTGAVVGCASGAARDGVREALGDLEEARPYYMDIISLNDQISGLGKGASSLSEMLITGNSLAQVARNDLDRLEPLYESAQARLREVQSMDSSGDYGTYAGMAIAAIEMQKRAMAIERQLMDTLEEMLSVIPDAASGEQLGYYTGELERLAVEFSEATDAATEAADRADEFYTSHSL